MTKRAPAGSSASEVTRNWCGYRSETIAAEYETDAALKEWGGPGFPPDDHYFWSAWRAEQELRTEDFEWITAQG